MAIPFRKLLLAACLLTSVGCGPFFVKPGSQPPKDTEPPPITEVTAANRKEALAKIEKSLRDKPIQRVYSVPGNHGWIEDYEVTKIEDMGVETVLVGKRKFQRNQITCRITYKVTRWKTYGGKTKGEPSFRQEVDVRRYNF